MSSLNKKNLNKWFYAFIGAAVLLLAAIVTIIILGVSTPDAPIQPDDGVETGVYYYEVVDGEILLSLNSGNKFTLAGPSVNKSGDYTVTDGKITLDFIRDGDGTATATVGDGTITLVYEGATMTFIRKQAYTVSFDTAGGSAIESVAVINGKTLDSAITPDKANAVFIGWYTDADYTTRFDFGNTPITSSITLYARWADRLVGNADYTVSFELGYEGAPEMADAVAVSGKLYDLPTPKRDGYTFGGWFVSMYGGSDMLSYECTESTAVTSDLTLYAVWHETSSSKLPSPAVSVSESGLKWSPVSGSVTFQIKIYDAENIVIHERNTGTTSESFDFSRLPAGDYRVEVVAVASNVNNNSAPAIRYFKSNALDNVSGFRVIDGVLIYDPVENAEKYLVSVDCGNSEHNHTLFDNSLFTSFDFSNCEMQKGGIIFTVTAVADGYSSSTSAPFVYDRSLAPVSRVEYSEALDAFVWDAVEGASSYLVTITVGDATYTISNGTKTSISVSDYTGEISVSVTPVTKGYNSPEAKSASYNKILPATPGKITVSGLNLSWSAASGAVSYEIKIGTQVFQSQTNSFSLNNDALELLVGESYVISVRSINESGASPYSESVKFGYYVMNTHLTYKANTVYWTPVIGAENFEVRVNGGEILTVSGVCYAPITLTKSGVNIIEVRYTDFGGSEWSRAEVYAYEVTYNSRSMNGDKVEYLAVGDYMSVPTGLEKEGYTLTGWYNTPAAANGNGAPHASLIFSGTGDTVLYANWTPKDYSVKVYVDSTITNVIDQSTYTVTYTKSFTLPIAESTDEERGFFAGWYDGPSGSGTQLTDAQGNSVAPYPFTRDTVAYPFFDTGILSYDLLPNGTYGVKKGPNVNNGVNVKIPVEYKGVAVTMILDNAFYNCDTIETLSIPDTIKQIGVGVFTYADNLRYFEVYEGRPGENYETFYSSDNGAIIYYDQPSQKYYLEFFPKAMTGEYTISMKVDSIRGYAFRSAAISKILIEKNLTYIAENAFYSSSVKTIEFIEGGDKPLVIETGAFYRASSVTSLKLPKRLTELANIKTLDNLTSLATITVEKGGAAYSSVENMLCNALGDTILYVPKTLSGSFTVPSGIRGIADSVFTGNAKITSLTIPRQLNTIGKDCFKFCAALKSVTIEGDRNNSLIIGESAFEGSGITTLTFVGSEDGDLDRGSTSVGDYAFAKCTLLSTVTIEEGANVAKLGKHSFEGCTALEGLDVADEAAIIFIDDYAFAECTSLKTFTANRYTTNINSYVFSGCSYLESFAFAKNVGKVAFGTYVFDGCARLQSVEIPATLSDFDGTAFNGCVSLKTINVDPENPYLLTDGGVLYTKDQSAILFYPKALDADEDTLKALPWDKITTIGGSVFGGNNKISVMYIGERVTSIGDHAFDGCQKMKKVNFAPNTSEGADLVIGEYAFANCPRLTSLPVPEYTSEIGAYCLYNSALKIFTVPSSLSVIKEHTFDSTKLISIIIPATVTEIGNGAFANVTTLESVTIDGGDLPLTIGSASTALATDGVFANTIITSLVIPDRVTVIGGYSFYNVSKLTSLTISPTTNLEKIGAYAFYSTAFSAIELGEKLTEVGNYAFASSSITSVRIPSTVAKIGKYAFNTSKLSTVSFGEGDVELEILDNAFASASFTEIVLPARVSAIGGMHSDGYRTAPSVFPSNLKSITVTEGGSTFATLDGVLYEVNDKGELINLVFCPKKKTGEVVVPNTVISVESGAFYYTSLTTVTFEEFDKSDERYGTPLLTVGTCPSAGGRPYNAPVFGDSKTLRFINFPSHLKTLGSYTIYRLLLVNNENKAECNGIIRFNPDAQPINLLKSAMNSAASINELYLPAIGYMESHAVQTFTNLSVLEIAPGTTITEFPMSSFSGASRVTTFTLPASIQSIGTHAFSGFKALTEFKYEEGCALREIGQQAFEDCAFESFTIPSTVELIGKDVFKNCKNLKTIKLARNFTAISLSSNYPFSSIPSLEAIEVEEGNRFLSSIDGVLFDAAGTILYSYPAGRPTEGGVYTVPEGVTSIHPFAFATYTGTTVILPNSLEKIGSYAFKSSETLENIYIPGRVTEIGSYAFTLCSNLKSVTVDLNGSLQSIGENCFESSTALKTVILPDTVTEIGMKAFQSCNSLESIVIPAGITVIKDQVFYSCTALKSVTLQDGLLNIKNNAFYGCRSLVSIAIPDTVTSIEIGAFQGASMLESIVITQNSSLAAIYNTAFQDCTSLKNVYIPDTVKSFGNGIFEGCTSLESVSIGAGSSILPVSMFEGCTSLKSVVIPDGITTLGSSIFKNCTSLTDIEIAASVSIISDSAFYGCTALTNVSFDAGSKLSYIGSSAFYKTSALESIDISDNVREIASYAFAYSGISDFTLPSSLVSIDSYAFKDCVNLKNADLPSGVTSVGNYAFSGCVSLESANLSLSLLSLGESAFANCVNIKSIAIPSTLTTMSGNPFANCTGVTSLTMASENESFVLDNGVLFDKSGYTLIYYSPAKTDETYTIPETVHEIASGAFSGAKFKTFVVSDNVTEIKDYTFMNCANLTEIEIPYSITSIGTGAFKDCSALLEITIPYSVSSVGSYAFSGCESLSKVEYEDRADGYALGSYLYENCKSLTDLTKALPKNVTALTPYMFKGAGIVSAKIPSAIYDITVEGVFYGCESLTSVTFPTSTSGALGDAFFWGCTSLEAITLPDSITALGSQRTTSVTNTLIKGEVFKGCTALKTVSVGNAMSNISVSSFEGCTELTTVTIRNANRTSISLGARAFANCSKLSSMEFLSYIDVFATESFLNCSSLVGAINGKSNGIGEIQKDAFIGCTGITELHIYTPGRLHAGAFNGFSESVKVYFKDKNEADAMKYFSAAITSAVCTFVYAEVSTGR